VSTITLTNGGAIRTAGAGSDGISALARYAFDALETSGTSSLSANNSAQ